jgi:hypothetical protein
MATSIFEKLNVINEVEEGLLNVLCTKTDEEVGIPLRKVLTQCLDGQMQVRMC